MKKYKIELIGETPLIYNAMKKEIEDERAALKKNELKEFEKKIWIKKAYFEKDKVIIPETWIKSCLVSACKKTRIVPHFATRKNETYTDYISTCLITDIKPVANKKDLKEYGAYLSAQGVMKGGKIWKIRPLLKKWKTSFIFIDSLGRIKKEELNNLFEYAGLFLGLGDSRINNFGRFKSKIYEVV